jgi:hypothetical protein
MFKGRRGIRLTFASPRARAPLNSLTSAIRLFCNARRPWAGIERARSSAGGAGSAPPSFANVRRTLCMCATIAAMERPHPGAVQRATTAVAGRLSGTRSCDRCGRKPPTALAADPTADARPALSPLARFNLSSIASGVGCGRQCHWSLPSRSAAIWADCPPVGSGDPLQTEGVRP